MRLGILVLELFDLLIVAASFQAFLNENKDKVVETNISPEVKENVPIESSVPVKNTISPEESKSPITAKEETVDKINSSSEKNETDKPKETSKSSLGLWFNTELRKQIQLTPKGWELRSV